MNKMLDRWITPHQVKLRYDLVSQSDIDLFHAKVEIDLISGCWIWKGAKSRTTRKSGNEYYGYLNFMGKLQSAHRASWTLHYGNIPLGLNVCHKCDNTSCCNPKHLFLGTDKENAADKIKKGRQNLPRGENHHRAKLTNLMVSRIKAMILSEEYSLSDIAKRFGVSSSCISEIKHEKNWAWIKQK